MFRTWFQRPVISLLEAFMADISPAVDAIAAKINDLRAPVREVLDENKRLLTENEALKAEAAGREAEEVRESESATRLETSFGELVGEFASPELPDVEPLPEPKAPVVDGSDDNGL